MGREGRAEGSPLRTLVAASPEKGSREERGRTQEMLLHELNLETRRTASQTIPQDRQSLRQPRPLWHFLCVSAVEYVEHGGRGQE